MLLVNQIKLQIDYTYNDLKAKTASILKVFEDEINDITIDKISIDARKKPDIFLVVSAIVDVKNENSVLKRISSGQVYKYEPVVYNPKVTGTKEMINRPCIIGAGPCGLFAAYYLAKYGYKPIVLERGFDIESRTNDVEEFFLTGKLKRNSNVQFGEGGAGAFSDGKLNTLVKDKEGRNKEVLKLFVECGANENILTDAKPHIGTDVLVTVVKNLRAKIISMGGEFRFNAEVTDFEFKENRLSAVIVNGLINIPCSVCVLAIGHSARNTFETLYDKGVSMQQKDFAVGLRVEHPQKLINKAAYGDDEKLWSKLPTASYKLTYHAENGRGVYSFCMCPGGYVVNASSEPQRTCVNGMSYNKRDGKHANSAIIVSVTKDDFNSEHPLSGMYFQRDLEEKTFNIGKGAIPVEYYGDFKREINTGLSDLTDMDPNKIFSETPECKGQYLFSSLADIMPRECSTAFVEAMEYFNKIIPGFNNDTTILSAIESRTSSPVRISRNDSFESENISGLYPAGEGAGYAGGIMSAAMDGMKVFEAIALKYKPIEC